MSKTIHVRKLMTLALLLAGAVQMGNAAANAAAEGSAPAAAGDAASAPAGVKPSTAPSMADKALTYAELVKLSPATRRAIIEKLSSDEQAKFLFSLTDMQRAVLLFDPDDCSSMTKLKRRSYATGEKADGVVEGMLKSTQGSVTRGILGFLPGGKQLVQAAEINETRIGIQEQVAYVDVCDLSADERAALLHPVVAHPAAKESAEQGQAPKPARGFFDRLTEIVTR